MTTDKFYKSVYTFASPLIVPMSEHETLEDFRNRWVKVDALPEEKKFLLSSDITLESIMHLKESLQLSLEETAVISRIVRAVICSELSLDLVASILIRNLPTRDAETKAKILDSIKNEILKQKIDLKAEAEEERQSQAVVSSVKLSILEALSQYSKIGEQNVTANPINLQNYPEPVRPSVRHWIKDYQNNLGSMKHSAIDRGNFLFHGENSKMLSAAERQRLALILKSLDEKTLLTIDPIAEVIIFENITDKTPADNTVIPAENILKTVFSAADSDDRFYQPRPIGLETERNSSPNFALPMASSRQNDFYQGASVRENIAQMPESVEISDPFLKNVTFSPDVQAGQSAETNLIPALVVQSAAPVHKKTISFLRPWRKKAANDDSKIEKKDDKKENYFAMPPSKPPIGSDEYNIKNLQFVDRASGPLVVDAPVVDNVPASPAADTLKIFAEPAVTRETLASVEPTRIEKIENDLPIVSAEEETFSADMQNPESLSDEMLFKLYQEKKLPKLASNPNFSQALGKSKLTSLQGSPTIQTKPNPYHIFSGAGGGEMSGSQKNIVDLKVE